MPSAIRQSGPFDFVRSPDEAEEILNDDASLKRRLEPKLIVLDKDSLHSHRSLVILPPPELAPDQQVLPPLISVITVSSHTVDQSVETALERLSSYSAERLLVCPFASNYQPALHLLRTGAVQSVVFSDEENAAHQIETAINTLKRRHEQTELRLASKLLGHGPTAFLNDPPAMKLIFAAAEKKSAVELRLALDPPGVMMLAPPSPPIFLMICDENYLQGLKEISEETKSHKPTGFGETEPHRPLLELVDGARPVTDGSPWYYVTLPSPGDFNLFTL